MNQLPEPLTPPDCDLRDFPSVYVDVRKIFDSKLSYTLDATTFRAGFMLMVISWHQVPASSLPDDNRILAKLSGAGRKWSRIREGALCNFVKCTDGRFYHPDIAERALVAWRKKQAYLSREIRRLEIESGVWAMMRAAVFERDNFTCQYCGVRGGRLECDHVVPVVKGGKTDMSNLKTACISCNRSKGSKTLEEWRK